MSAEEAIIAALKDAVSPYTIYPLIISQNAKLPAIAYSVSPEPILTQNGPANTFKVKAKFTVVSKSFSEGAQVAETLKGAVKGISKPGSPAFVVAETSTFNKEAELYERTIDVTLWHKEV